MRLPDWIKLRYLRTLPSRAHLTKCPKCEMEIRLVDRTSMSGDDMRSYRCDQCQEEHILDFGTATWKLLSERRESEG